MPADKQINADLDQRNIAQRMNAVMQKIDYIQKENKEGMKYTIVSHDKVTELVRPHCVEQGIIYYPLHGSFIQKQDGNRTELVGAVRFENIDDRDDYVDVASMGYGIDSQDKGPGKAISYMVKYALLKAFGLATGDDPDLDQTTTHRSTLDDRVEILETAISTTASTVDFKALMAAPATVEIMAALNSRNPGEWNRVKALMSSRSREIKQMEEALATADKPAT